jgi:asparagine synthase (glutamine-hydrolysing)
MADAIRYRGPDSDGYWEETKSGVALGHRRLAIIDLSEAGHQPMHSASGRFVLVFNGEIYNFQDLRRQLLDDDPSLRFRGHSDTEMMLAAFERWGIYDSLQKFNGMFAFALWDRSTRALSLARDRMGEKPLYYSLQGSTFLFGSELKALRANSAFSANIDRTVVASYLRLNCVPGQSSIYEGVYKLAPGCLLELGADRTPHITPYWSLEQAAKQSLANPFTGSEDDAIEELDRLLRDAVSIRMLADVPLGAFLSGGIDSSTVTALMQASSASPVGTFSIGFDQADFDEAKNAKQIAEHLHTEHTELVVTAEEARGVIPTLPHMYDEPFGDSSQIPTHLVARMTRKYVTVALSGDGGDELFGGYNRHAWLSKLWGKVGGYPLKMRQAAGYALSTLSPNAWDGLFRAFDWALPGDANQRARGEKIHKIANIVDAEDPFAMYSRLLSHCSEADDIVVGVAPSLVWDSRGDWLKTLGIADQMMFLDMGNYLPDDILVKVDRAAMAVSLEGRIPFLDHRVVEFAWRLPLAFKIRDQQGKWILRRLLSRYVPPELFERPKAGFAIPLAEWLRGPLFEWAESLLSEDRLRREGYLNPKAVRKSWSKFLKGGRNLQFHIWDVLMFQSWLESITQREASEVSSAIPGGTQ